jgi:serine protease AprX
MERNPERRILVLLLLAMLPAFSSLKGQTAPGKYWVKFTDKNGTPYSLDNPSAFLSPRTVANRIARGIGFDERDLPVNPDYVSQLLGVGNLHLHNRSRWFNAVTVEVADTLLEAVTLEAIAQLPMVAEVRNTHRAVSSRMPEKATEPWERTGFPGYPGDAYYGPSFRQIQMLNGHTLHQMGYTGEGMVIALLDAGWGGTDQLPAMEHLYERGRIAGMRDFVNPRSPNVYQSSLHGTFVLSHMAGIIPDSLRGTAPDAHYYLFRTEDVSGEYRVEEDNWVAAAELADSLGADLINSSLGYSLFDDPEMSYTPSDMNGQTARCTIAADIAASKGILVVNSAGNSGSAPWRSVTAPSDGFHVLAVGAVDSDGVHALFSGYGPSADGRVKPDIVAMGKSTVFADLDSTIRTGNGTSFSAPIITGLAACLWQAYPGNTASEIADAIRRSAHLYAQPNDSMGYGIPDFFRAFELLKSGQVVPDGPLRLRLFPNPANNYVQVSFFSEESADPEVLIHDAAGRLVMRHTGFTGPVNGSYYHAIIPVEALRQGMYFLEIRANTLRQTERLIITDP